LVSAKAHMTFGSGELKIGQSWVKRLLSLKTSNWKVIPRKYLDKFGKNWLIFKRNMDNQ
jgi:hypothetical protein